MHDGMNQYHDWTVHLRGSDDDVKEEEKHLNMGIF